MCPAKDCPGVRIGVEITIPCWVAQPFSRRQLFLPQVVLRRVWPVVVAQPLSGIALFDEVSRIKEERRQGGDGSVIKATRSDNNRAVRVAAHGRSSSTALNRWLSSTWCACSRDS